MPRYGRRSLANLETADPILQRVFFEVINHFDCSILCGHRGMDDQNRAFHEGTSEKKWPDGNHNSRPSKAVDAVPYPILWHHPDPRERAFYEKRMYMFGGFVLGIAQSMNIPLRWGADWDSDTRVNDHKFIDLPHFGLRILRVI